MMEAVFKPIETGDIPTVTRMMENFYSIDNYPIDVPVAKGLLAEFIENETLGKGWLILNNGLPVGYMILTFVFSFEYKGKIAFLDEFYISGEARGRGMGKQGLDFIKEQAKHYEVKIIYLEVEPHNEKAEQLYLSKDFYRHNRKLMKCVIT